MILLSRRVQQQLLHGDYDNSQQDSDSQYEDTNYTDTIPTCTLRQNIAHLAENPHTCPDVTMHYFKQRTSSSRDRVELH